MESTKFGKKRGLAASGPKGKPQEDTMRFRILFSFLLTALFVLASSCGTTPNCPVCGTTKNGAYAVINVIPVPEHNNTGEPGGPFNSFDISTIAPNPAVAGHYLDYVSDRIGIAMQVIDTSQDLAVFSIQGSEFRRWRRQRRQPMPHDPAAWLHRASAYAECRGDSANRRRLWQLRSICLQD